MGLNKRTWTFINSIPLGKGDGRSMLELGNIVVRSSVRGIVGDKYNTGKQLFSHLGFKHTSIDLNGKHGSLALDLSLPINSKFYNSFSYL